MFWKFFFHVDLFVFKEFCSSWLFWLSNCLRSNECGKIKNKNAKKTKSNCAIFIILCTMDAVNNHKLITSILYLWKKINIYLVFCKNFCVCALIKHYVFFRIKLSKLRINKKYTSKEMKCIMRQIYVNIISSEKW